MIEPPLWHFKADQVGASIPLFLLEPRILHLQARLHSPQAVEFAVTDTGIGIAPEVAQRLFTPFFTTKDEGMGLGLSLCRSVLEQHGSTLRHQPHLPRGTRFSFTLPVARSIL